MGTESLRIMQQDSTNGSLRFVKILYLGLAKCYYTSDPHFQCLKQGKEKEVWLKDLKYGVFGLGNRQYEHFNKVNRLKFTCSCDLDKI